MMNRVLLVGEIESDDPFIGVAVSGDTFAKFTVHTWEAVPGKGFRHQRTSCVAYNSIAEMIETHSAKGKPVVVEGKLNHYKANDGQFKTEVVCERIVFTDKQE
jgi:single-stranded DNA-binding protein